MDQAREWLRDLPNDPEAFAEYLGTELPRIHNVYRWWRQDVLREMLAIREAARKVGGIAREHLLLALAQIVYASANITLGRLQVAFKERPDDIIEPCRMFDAAARHMVEDLALAPAARGAARILQHDSRDLPVLEAGISAVFCSPPYPNRYSYVWNTRPHLYLLELIETAREAADIDCETIGGTWGRATTNLERIWIEPTKNVLDVMSDTLNELEPNSTLMRNYVTKYFNDLDEHLGSLRRRVDSGTPIGYVVGNSETKGVMVQTHTILQDLMTANGFVAAEMDILRARNSGEGLVEVTVNAVAE